ncbi:MAG TPA: phosphatidylglycerophosphatase A [Pyrinomonadaceae bacterium]|nr:phosphatidylglycerophosphatase A [Pyrinomonadaceae bacterium]
MKTEIERRKAEGPLDFVSLGVTTFGVGFLPLAPGTWGSMVGVAIYLAAAQFHDIWLHHWSVEHAFTAAQSISISVAAVAFALTALTLIGIWAAGRAIPLLGNTDPAEAVIDEVVGMLVTLLFVPFSIGWPFILAGFLLFRLFDIWKPYPIDMLQVLPGGVGIVADDVVAGVYAGVCLSVIYAVSISL